MNKLKINFFFVVIFTFINLYAEDSSSEIFEACDETFETGIIFDENPQIEISCRLNANSKDLILACKEAFSTSMPYALQCIKLKKDVERVEICSRVLGHTAYDKKISCINSDKANDLIIDCDTYFRGIAFYVDYCIKDVDRNVMDICKEKKFFDEIASCVFDSLSLPKPRFNWLNSGYNTDDFLR